MDRFPDTVKFHGTWRPYQARVLHELDRHIKDRRLHVVAAPGSGKTVLGLEVIIRLDRPTLVLTPSLAIRNQWAERLVDLFLPPGSSRPDWISFDVKTPDFLTVTTYQGLHAAMKDESRGRRRRLDRAAIDRLHAAGVQTIVLDEAHHLRREWWECLDELLRELQTPSLVGLTATPPYDVGQSEWNRYQDLCGPIDAEISVPELVREKNLCPHQDYAFFSRPNESEQQQIHTFRQAVRDLATKYLADDVLITTIRNHPFMTRPLEHLDEIFTQCEYGLAMLTFLRRISIKLPHSVLRHLDIKLSQIPPFSYDWMEILFKGVLFQDRDRFSPDLRQDLRSDLRRCGALKGRRLSLRVTPEITRLLQHSSGKINSIRAIVRREHNALKDRLRLLVLTDYIRRGYLSTDPEQARTRVTQLGVVPIFEALRQDETAVRLGLLSGSLGIIPAAALPALQHLLQQNHIDRRQLTTSRHPRDDRYLLVDLKGKYRPRLVGLITELLTHGEITVLVGTKSLLGEGWDAPPINALILASYVGSYMLSNQMRGRAIRLPGGNPDKTANIWHLVTMEAHNERPGEDFDLLERRFRAFVGLSHTEPLIESGIERLGLTRQVMTDWQINETNQQMFTAACRRDRMSTRWRHALSTAAENRLLQDIETTPDSLPRKDLFKDGILVIISETVAVGGALFAHSLIDWRAMWDGADALISILFLAFIASGLALLPRLVQAIWLLIRHGTPAAGLKQIGLTVLDGLCHADTMETPRRQLTVKTDKRPDNRITCYLSGGTTYEQSLFSAALTELFGPIRNPRYLLVRKSRFRLRPRTDYYAVPTLLGRNKDLAGFFARRWRRRIGPARLLYTRYEKGRLTLLKARLHSLSAAFSRRVENAIRWR